MGHFKGEQRLFKTAPKKYGAEDDSEDLGEVLVTGHSGRMILQFRAK